MKKEQFYISTIDENSRVIALEAGFGIEIAEYCTAWNMDDEFEETDPVVRKTLDGIESCVLHGPFNELFPCAIDRKVRALAAERYRQAIALAKEYGAKKVIFHSGYYERLYYPVWFIEQSILFWKDYFKEDPGVEIVLENVFEEEPQMLADIVSSVNHPNFRICLDIGHVNAYSKIPVSEWIDCCAPWISHFHVHNNDTSRDSHSALDCGTIPMKAFFEQADRLCPDATYTLELIEAAPSVRWMLDQIFIKVDA
ncbi:MAG: sugar phosphate isomerase/epimerase [Lachnospiraceae bacterium]|nr:sugar phosphate isomerase/epimerase [Lachnospiraceae bacterium]